MSITPFVYFFKHKQKKCHLFENERLKPKNTSDVKITLQFMARNVWPIFFMMFCYILFVLQQISFYSFRILPQFFCFKRKYFFYKFREPFLLAGRFFLECVTWFGFVRKSRIKGFAYFSNFCLLNRMLC